MKLKDLLLYADALLITSDIGNSKYYDEWNSHLLSSQFKEDTVKEFELKTLMNTKTLIVKLEHWQ